MPDFTQQPSSCNTAGPLSSDWHRVSPRFAVRFIYRSGARLDAEWMPRQPGRHELRKAWPHYCRARDAFAATVAAHCGRASVLVLEQ